MKSNHVLSILDVPQDPVYMIINFPYSLENMRNFFRILNQYEGKEIYKSLREIFERKHGGELDVIELSFSLPKKFSLDEFKKELTTAINKKPA